MTDTTVRRDEGTMAEVLSRRPSWRRTLLRVCVLYTGITVTASVYALADGLAARHHGLHGGGRGDPFRHVALGRPRG